MNILFVDFETYYSEEFGLKTAPSTSQYIAETQVQLMGWAIGSDPIKMAIGEDEVRQVLASVDWANTALTSHNIRFDARIVKERFGHEARFYFDTMAMMAANRWDVLQGGLKLSHLSKVLRAMGLSIEDKGDEIKEAKGKYIYQFANGTWYMHDQEITAEYLKQLNFTKTGKKRTGKAVKDPRAVVAKAIDLFNRFKDYCVNDVDICRKGFYEMKKTLSAEELVYQDMIHRCALTPQMVMDLPMLKQALNKAETGLRTAVKTVANKWYNGDYNEAKSALLSSQKLGLLLKAVGGMTRDEVDDHLSRYGYDPEPLFIIPTKISEKESKSKGYPVYKYALAKKDPEMAELQALDIPDLQEVLACRKTAVYYNNYEIPRLNRFIGEMEYLGEVGMPLKVSSAHTHRLGGDVLNIQNLSSGRNEGQDAAMRKAIMAKPGREVVAADSSQVECLDGNGLLMTDKGLVRMLDVTLNHKLWDGVEFVSHDGLVCKGEKYVIEYQGIIGTPEHIVYREDGKGITLDEAKATSAVLSVGESGGKTIWTVDSLATASANRHQKDCCVDPLRVWDRETHTSIRLKKWQVETVQKLFRQGTFEIHKCSPTTETTATSTVQLNSRASESSEVFEPNVLGGGEQVQLLPAFCRVCVGELSYGYLRWDGDRQNRYLWALRTREYQNCYPGRERSDTPLQHNGLLRQQRDVGSEIHEGLREEVGGGYGERLLSEGSNATMGSRLCSKAEDYQGSFSWRDNDEVEVLEDVPVQGGDNSRFEDMGQGYTTKWGNKPIGIIKVYDIVNAGSRNRFCYNGVIVSNCRVLAWIAKEDKLLVNFQAGKDPYCVMASIMYGEDADFINRQRKAGVAEYVRMRSVAKSALLGCGYGMGGASFKDYAASIGVDLSEEEAMTVNQQYRQANQNIVRLWGQMTEILKHMIAGGEGYFGGPNGNTFYYTGNRYIAGIRVPGIRLPDGLWLSYRELKMAERTYADGTKKWNFSFYGIKEGKPGWQWIYGAKVVENITQALAFSIMKWQALRINKESPIAFNVHDEWVTTAPSDKAHEVENLMTYWMSQVPEWATGCPITAEAGRHQRYGEID